MACTLRGLVATIVLATLLLQLRTSGPAAWERHAVRPLPSSASSLQPSSPLPSSASPWHNLTSDPPPPSPSPLFTQPSQVVPTSRSPRPPALARASEREGDRGAERLPNRSMCTPRRLLHWNILDGGGKRIDGIARFLKDGHYDVVTLNELNGFDPPALAKLGLRCGLPHTMLLAKSRYHLGVLSRHPLRALATETGSEFAHGLLCVRVLDVSLCVAHLNPHDATRRAMEARRIIGRHGRPIIDAGLPFMLVGDLNTLSPLDRPAHDAAGITQRIRTGPYAKPLSKKFLTRTAVDYTPMQLLLDGPLTDVGAAAGNTVPTEVNADRMHFAMLRLDYCLVSAAMLEALPCDVPSESRKRVRGPRDAPRVRAITLRDERTNALSDHFPLEVTFHQLPGRNGDTA